MGWGDSILGPSEGLKISVVLESALLLYKNADGHNFVLFCSVVSVAIVTHPPGGASTQQIQKEQMELELLIHIISSIESRSTKITVIL